MSYKLLAFDLEVLLERLQGGTNFPYGDGDKLLIDRINQTARELLLAEPIAAEISEASVLLEVRRWGTGEKAADLYQAQCIAMLLDGTPVYDHGNALRGSGMALMNTLRDWLNEAKRQRLGQKIAEETPRHPKPRPTLSPIQSAMKEVLLNKAQTDGPEASASSSEISYALSKRGFGKVTADRISKAAKALSRKGYECRSGGPYAGYRLISCDPLDRDEVGLARSGKKLARSGS